MTASAMGPSSAWYAGVPTQPTVRSAACTGAPRSGNAPSRCSSTSRRGGRPRLCVRATVSWPAVATLLQMHRALEPRKLVGDGAVVALETQPGAARRDPRCLEGGVADQRQTKRIGDVRRRRPAAPEGRHPTASGGPAPRPWRAPHRRRRPRRSAPPGSRAPPRRGA